MRGMRIDPEKEQQAIELYRQGLSEARVARKLGIYPKAVHRILVRHAEPRRSLSEAISIALTKYPKTDFSGNPTEQARILGFSEDCGLGYAGKHIHVQTSTTHPAQIKLFDETFGVYGHISRTPGYNKQFSIYQWQLQILLNRSFDFLIEYKDNPMVFLSKIAESGFEYYYIGGLAEAESCVGVYNYRGRIRATLLIANNNRELLEWSRDIIGGSVLRHNDGYNLQLRDEEAIEALRRLPLSHEEKAATKELILKYFGHKGIDSEPLSAYEELRRKIKQQVRLCTTEARLEYIRRHGQPHPNDPDQTIPKGLTPSRSLSFLSV